MRYDFRNLTFREIADEELERELKACSQEFFVPRKKVFFVEGDELDKLYYIRSGIVLLYMADRNGAEKALYRLTRGWFFGETVGLLELKRTTLHFLACEDVCLYGVGKEEVDRLLATSARFRDSLLSCSCYKTLALRYEIANFTYCSSKTRLLKSLYRYVDASQVIDGQWHALAEKKTHYELAADVGATRVTISRLIGELCREGRLRIVNGQIQFSCDLYKEITSDAYDPDHFFKSFL